MKRPLRVGMVSLGCPRNLVDSEFLLGNFREKGFRIAESIEHADIGIVNTCAFVNDAKKESIDAILDLVELKESGKLKKIIVCGCLSQRYRDELRRQFPQVDAFVGRFELTAGQGRFALTPSHSAYIKISEGCISNCSFCIIPKLKPRFSSLAMEEVLRQASRLDAEGVREINLIGQDVSAYGLDIYKEPKLADLVRKIARECRRVSWIRLLYLYPSRITDGLLHVVRDEPKVCKYIDVPVQHISSRILKAMNRRTSRREILELIGKIRKNIPGAALRTSVIVGFPGATDRVFKELLSFIEDAQFERLGAFIYSKEEGTKAALLPGQVPQRVKEARFDEVMALQQGVATEVNRRFMGKLIDVLIEEKQSAPAGGMREYVGRSQYDAPEVDGSVFVRSKKVLAPGDIVPVRITDTLEYDLVGEC